MLGVFHQRLRVFFFQSFKFDTAAQEHKQTWQKKPSSQVLLDGQDWIPQESNSNHYQQAFCNGDISFYLPHWIIITFNAAHCCIKHLSRGCSHVGGKKGISPPHVAWHKPLVEKMSALESDSPRGVWKVPRTQKQEIIFPWNGSCMGSWGNI